MSRSACDHNFPAPGCDHKREPQICDHKDPGRIPVTTPLDPKDCDHSDHSASGSFVSTSGPNAKYPGLYPMAKKLAKLLGKHPDWLRKTILENVRHLMKNIPPDEMLAIFEEDDSDAPNL